VEKTISIAYSESAFVALVVQHVKDIRHTVIVGISGSTIFFPLSQKWQDFRVNAIEHKLYVLSFSETCA